MPGIFLEIRTPIIMCWSLLRSSECCQQGKLKWINCTHLCFSHWSPWPLYQQRPWYQLASSILWVPSLGYLIGDIILEQDSPWEKVISWLKHADNYCNRHQHAHNQCNRGHHECIFIFSLSKVSLWIIPVQKLMITTMILTISDLLQNASIFCCNTIPIAGWSAHWHESSYCLCFHGGSGWGAKGNQ